MKTLYSGKIRFDLLNYAPRKYLGLSEPERKKHFYNHTHYSNNREYAKSEVAKDIWRIKDQGGSCNVEWNKVGLLQPTTQLKGHLGSALELCCSFLTKYDVKGISI